MVHAGCGRGASRSSAAGPFATRAVATAMGNGEIAQPEPPNLFAPKDLPPYLEVRIVMQNDVQQGAVNLQVAVVVDEAQSAKLIVSLLSRISPVIRRCAGAGHEFEHAEPLCMVPVKGRLA
jgi:hypothetical protein